MPPINRYECKTCGFILPQGWGGQMYVEDDNGERIYCVHPREENDIRRVLGESATLSLVKAKIGFNSYCLCLDCFHLFAADLADETANPWRRYATDAKYWGERLNVISARDRIKDIWPSLFHTQKSSPRGRDKRQCPKCQSTSVKTVFELIGQPCPKCKGGKIEEIETGIHC